VNDTTDGPETDLPDTMVAVQIIAPEQLEVVERPVARPGPGEVLIRVTAAGICGSDVELLHGQRPAEFSTYPVIPGHEWTGTVAAVGEGVDGPTPGTPVVACGIRGCGRCERCREGLTNLCSTSYAETGFTEPGGWAQYVVVPAVLVYPVDVPDGVDPTLAALLEPASCVANGLLTSGITVRPGLHAAVVGTGTLSLVAVALLAAAGVKDLTVIGSGPSALELAREWGVGEVVDPATAASPDWSGGADLVFEAGARPESARMALMAARRGGTVVLEGVPSGPDEHADLSQIVLRNLRVQGVFGASPAAWGEAVRLFGAGTLDLAPLVSHRLALAEVSQAFDLLADRPPDLRKVLLLP